ncbi:MAG: AmmeMemoRadiSam system protein A [Deltaproteobacteria bacterium]|jgi:AmmeMemoRadiSam system protein A|nr:AmmeMemoRadiSam system protein A [Deltaproteobacteria bacterium]
MTKEISKSDGILLLELARQSIIQEFQNKGNKLKSLKDKASSLILEENRGIFVTLHKNRRLRGCIGNIEPVKNIFQGVLDNAKNAAFSDTRFSPLSLEELDETIIEVSILTQPENIYYTDSRDLITKLKPGIDGVIIKKDYNSATFLPQVWEQLKDPEIFLKHLCTKAGLPPDDWKSGDLDVATYQIQLFEES